MSFGQYTYPTARKEHRCEWCGEKILKSEKHVRYTGVWEGEFQNWRMHYECNEDASHDRYILEDGFTPFSNERPKIGELYS